MKPIIITNGRLSFTGLGPYQKESTMIAESNMTSGQILSLAAELTVKYAARPHGRQRMVDLLAKYGAKKIPELPIGRIQDYIAELRKLLEVPSFEHGERVIYNGEEGTVTVVLHTDSTYEIMLQNGKRVLCTGKELKKRPPYLPGDRVVYDNPAQFPGATEYTRGTVVSQDGDHFYVKWDTGVVGMYRPSNLRLAPKSKPFDFLPFYQLCDKAERIIGVSATSATLHRKAGTEVRSQVKIQDVNATMAALQELIDYAERIKLPYAPTQAEWERALKGKHKSALRLAELLKEWREANW